MAKGNSALLIFDFDNTITNGHMHGTFSGRHFGVKKSDYNSAAEGAVTDADIRKFIENEGGIKNKEKLKSVLQSALSKGIEVSIASFTGYPNAVKRVVENHLGLSKEQEDSVSIFGHFPKHYDSQLPERGQRDQFGKNLHICKAIVKYKDKNGRLPKTVMLVDDDKTNIEKINEFVESVSKREGWLKENGLSIEDINNIKFKGVQVPQQDKDAHYLERVQKFVNANLVQEPIYENLKKEEPIYQNLQDIQKQLSEEKPPQLPPKPGFNTKTAPPLPPKPENSKAKPALPPKKRKLNKVHTANGVAANSKNEEQIYTQNISVPVVKETEVHFPYCSELDLETPMQRLRDSFQKDDLPEKAIHAIYSLFKEKVIKAIRERGDRVIEKSEVLYIESRHRHNNDSKITDDSFTQIMAQIQEKKKEIKDLASNYQGEDIQLRKEISELLNVNLQKTNINPNYVTINHSEVQQAAASPRRYIKITQDKNTGNNTSERDKREKGKKTDLGSTILNYIPYRNNNRTENSTATKENRTESAKPSLTKEFLFRVGTIVIGFLFGGPIGVAIALGIVAVDIISNGKLIQGAEKVLGAGYDALSAVGKKMLNVGKATFSKIKEAQGLSKRDIEVSDPNHSPKSHVTSEGEPKAKSQVKAELKRRASAASQEQSAKQQISQYR